MIVLLAACSSPTPSVEAVRPPSVPDDVASLRFRGEQIELDGKSLLPWSELSASSEPLDLPTQRVWLAAPGTARWTDVRRLLDSVDGPFWLSDLAQPVATGPYDKTPRGTVVSTCPDGPIPVKGVHRRLNLELDADSAQAWVTATVRFLPRIERGGSEVVANLFQNTCWSPSPCEDCPTAAPVESVRVAGPEGCFLPLAKGFRGHESWRTEIPARLTDLGFDADADVLVTASEAVPFSAVTSLLQGLEAAGIQPRLGLVPMGSGSGAPLCDTPIRTADQVAAAGEAWYQNRNARVRRGEK